MTGAVSLTSGSSSMSSSPVVGRGTFCSLLKLLCSEVLDFASLLVVSSEEMSEIA